MKKLIINLIIFTLFATQADALLFQSALLKNSVNTMTATNITNYFDGKRSYLTFQELGGYLRVANTALRINGYKLPYSKLGFWSSVNNLIISTNK